MRRSQSPKGNGAGPAAASKPRSSRGWWRAFLVLILIVAGGAFAAFQLWPGEIEHQRIRLEREIRATLFDLGITLPGTPDVSVFDSRLKAHGVALGTPVFMRIFKREFELELWLLRDGRYHRFATYPVCRWSGRLGPKLVEGDRQAPEGFYLVDETALNPNSKWHRSFNLGFPNAFDAAQGRTGSFLMVHGGCGSIGCYAMTDPVIDEIWRLITAALRNGQQRFQVQVFPFRMTESNLARHAGSPLAPFWRELKPGYDLFEDSQLPPKVSVCQGRYAFEAANSPADGSAPIVANCPQASSPKP